MKNSPTEAQLRPAWTRALRSFDGSLRARGMAEKTRRAYGVDLDQLARWAGPQGLDPEALDHRTLRRFAGVLSERGHSRSTVARKLAAIRTFYRHLLERGEIEGSPADLVSSPKRDSYLPRVLRADEVAAILDAIPQSEPSLDTKRSASRRSFVKMHDERPCGTSLCIAIASFISR